MIARRQDAPFSMPRFIAAAILMLCSGCGQSESAGTVEAPPARDQPATSTATPHEVTGTGVTPGQPVAETTVAPAVESAQQQAARDAFAVLITPGSDSAAWDEAQQKLVSLGADATPILLEGLQSKNPLERETAATVCALAGATDTELQAALVVCLTDESTFVRANAAAALAQSPAHQQPVIAALTELLSESDPQLRRMAAANLGAFGAEASAELPKLTAVLADNDAEVVTPVIQLLGRMGPSAVDAVPQLQKIAFEEEGELKQAAEQALLLIQTEDASEPESTE